MSNLSTLPDDVRYEIVTQLAEPTDRFRYPHEKNPTICPFTALSSTCRSLNATCGIFIFRRYHLDLRRHTWRSKEIYPPGSDSKQWDTDAINLRLAHLRSKAPFVWELIITDHGEMVRGKDSEMSKPKAFPDEFMPELLATLRVLSNVTAIHLDTHPTIVTLINAELWNWAVGMRPTTLSLDGCFDKPANHGLASIKHLQTLSLHSCMLKTIDLFDFQNITKLSLTYGPRDEHVTFAPEHENLKHIGIEIDMWGRDFTSPFFDFSKVPQASISVKATFYVELKGHIPSAWSKHKPNLQRMFSEGLSVYNVDRTEQCAVKITRRSEVGWAPVNQIHLEGYEAEVQERKAMNAYYAMRMRQEFGSSMR